MSLFDRFKKVDKKMEKEEPDKNPVDERAAALEARLQRMSEELTRVSEQQTRLVEQLTQQSAQQGTQEQRAAQAGLENLSEEEYEEVIENPAKLAAFIKSTAQQAQPVTKDDVAELLNEQLTRHSREQEFFRQNPDLDEDRDLVDMIAAKWEPDKFSNEDPMQQFEAHVRKKLNRPKDAQTQTQAQPAHPFAETRKGPTYPQQREPKQPRSSNSFAARRAKTLKHYREQEKEAYDAADAS